MHKASILVIGSQGQVGGAISELMKQKKIDFQSFNRKQLDISDELSVSKIISSIKPKIIINCAAYTAVDNAENEPEKAKQINTLGPYYLAKACEANDACLIHISTDYVFGNINDSDPRPLLETDLCKPLGVYGQTKLDGERMVISNCKKSLVIRTSWVFSAFRANFVKTMISLAKNNQELKIVDDQWGAPTSALAIANCCLILIDKILGNGLNNLQWGIYHFCGSPYTTWKGFAENIFHQAHKLRLIQQVPNITGIPSLQYRTLATRPLNSRLDCNKILENFAIQQENWKDSLTKVLMKLNS